MGVCIDWCGYVVLFYVIEYWENRVVLDINILVDNVDLDNVVVNVVFICGVIV